MDAPGARAPVDFFPDLFPKTRVPGRRGGSRDSQHGGPLQLRQVCEGAVHESGKVIRTVHIDTGRHMHGGQWQALYLIEKLCGAKLLTRRDSGLFEEARKRGVEVMPLSFPTLVRLARKADVVHAHDARAHTLAAMAGGPPVVVSRRVGFPVKRTLASQWKYSRAALYLAVSRFVAERLKAAGVAEERVRVVYDGVPLPVLTTREPGRVVALAAKTTDVPGILIHLTTNLWQDLSSASVFVYVSDIEGLASGALAA